MSYSFFSYNQEHYRINQLKTPNVDKNLNRASILVSDKLTENLVDYTSEAKTMNEAREKAKKRFLRETDLPIPPVLENKIDDVNYKWFRVNNLTKVKENLLKTLCKIVFIFFNLNFKCVFKLYDPILNLIMILKNLVNYIRKYS